jgi:predicted phage tail component-like protein
MIRESEYFWYDGVNSMEEFGIMNVSVDSTNLYSEPFLAPRTIKEFKVRGNDKPYFSEIQRDPLSFSLTFYFQDTWNDELISQVKQWLNQDYYKPLIFSELPDQIFYALVIDSPTLVHNGLKQGYVTLNIRCDSPYSYSPRIMTPDYNFTFSDENETTIINSGDLPIYPEIYIVKVGDGDLVIDNFNGGGSMKFTNLVDKEEIYINCEREYIETSIPNFYRYDSFNDYYMKFLYGKNYLKVSGKCYIRFQYQFKFL